MDRRTALPFIAALTMLRAPGVAAQVSSLNDAINKAGQQRMLSQRMSKAYLTLGMDVATEKSQAAINESMARFDRQLVELSAFAPRAEIKATYSKLEAVWGRYKAQLVGQAPRRESVLALFDLDSKVLELANQGVSQLEQLSGKPLGRLVNVAGRQRLLSQLAAKFYLAQAWKASIPYADSEMQKARNEFAAALSALEQAPESTSVIRQELNLARQQWVFFELALTYQGNGARSIENVFLASENVLSVMERVTVMLARQSA